MIFDILESLGASTASRGWIAFFLFIFFQSFARPVSASYSLSLNLLTFVL